MLDFPKRILYPFNGKPLILNNLNFMASDRTDRHTALENRRWSLTDLIEGDCNLCGSTRFVPLAQENGLLIVRCRDCGLIYVNPHPSDGELEKFYGQYYRPETSGLWKAATEPLFQTDAKRLEGFRAGGQLLDVGCGFGFFLRLMKDRGWEVSGCDLSRVAARHAREQLGLSHVVQGHFHELDVPDRCFDAITLWYVLHHMSDPRKVLEKAHRALKEQGVIAVRVPNMALFEILWRLKKFDCGPLRTLLKTLRSQTADPRAPYNVLDPPVHLFAFRPGVLRYFLEKTGFSVIGTFNDGMVSRGNAVNRIVDGGITRAADWIKLITRERVDLSISFSVYARKV